MTGLLTAPAEVRSAQRIASLDIVRGVVMVLMALDHVRVYSGLPAGGESAGIFFTRWVTHFCAPAFVFFAGTSAYLHGRKLPTTRALSRYLVTRGLLLVVLEVTIIRLSWRFSLSDPTVLAGVIWMLGWCMILLAPLVRFSMKTLAVVGLSIVTFQQVFGLIPNVLPASIRSTTGWFWSFLYLGGEVPVGQTGTSVTVLYTIVPWIGVMAAGFAFGAVMTMNSDDRRRACLRVGVAASALFIVLAFAGLYVGSPNQRMPALFQMLNQSKYPASQAFLLMTLGPTIALLPMAERMQGRIARALDTFGRVPLLYYLLHIPLIHAISLIVWQCRDGRMGRERFVTAPYVWMPEPERWSLPLLYLVFAAAVVMLYPACRFFAHAKATGRYPWLRYL